MKEVIVGSVLAAGVIASLFGAGAASAAPGVSVNVGGTEVGVGDHGTDKSADAQASKGNVAVAINTGLLPPGSSAVSANAITGSGNSAFALDGRADVYGGTNNHATGVYGAAIVQGGGHGNAIVGVGRPVYASTDADVPGQLSVTVCSTSFSGQADRIQVSPGGGLC